MKETYTPGPWRAERTDAATFRIVSDSRLVPIAHVGTGVRHKEQTKPNARLIAAAPDLLAALETFVLSYEAGHDVTSAEYEAGRTALERARGSTT